nr:unnamed protein product [Digitaria exilis]
MEITFCESHAYAVQHLGSCRWNLDEAINLYFTGGGGGIGSSDVSAPMLSEEHAVMEDDGEDYGFGGDNSGDDVRPPIPARVEALYEDGYHGTPCDASFFGDQAPYPPSAPPSAPVEATGWEEAANAGNGGQVVGSENGGGGHQAHDDAEQEENNNVENDEEGNEQSDDDNMSYDSDNEIEDYGLEVDEDSYYASIEDEDSTDVATMQRQQHSSLEELYQPPLDLMHNGSFHDAKVHAASEDRFLLTRGGAGDFQSMLYNRDLWSNELVKNMVKDSFVLLLLQKKSNGSNAHDDMGHLECSKVCSFYHLQDHHLPAVLVLDPITGQLLAKKSGLMTPDDFIDYVVEYTKSKPSTMCMPRFVRKISASSAIAPAAAPEISALAVEAGEKAPGIIPDGSVPAGVSCSEQEQPAPAPMEAEMEDVDDEPMEGEKMYKLRIRFPDGTMVAKEFGCKRKVASLFAFCSSAVNGKAFRIVTLARGAFQAVQGDGSATFEELGLNCTTVSVVFDA